MKNKAKTIVSMTLKGLFLGILTLALTVSCSSDDSSGDDSPSMKKEIKFGMATVSGAWPNTTTYLQGL